MSWGGIRPLSDQVSQRVAQDPKLGRRILRSRAYRDKNKGVGEVKAKCRMVLIGCQDPDIFSVSRDSPTPSRLSEALVLAIATAGANGEVNGDGATWRLWISDAKSAFLQKDQNTEERSGPLYMRAPLDLSSKTLAASLARCTRSSATAMDFRMPLACGTDE